MFWIGLIVGIVIGAFVMIVINEIMASINMDPKEDSFYDD